jgi:hypothetical protein
VPLRLRGRGRVRAGRLQHRAAPGALGLSWPCEARGRRAGVSRADAIALIRVASHYRGANPRPISPAGCSRAAAPWSGGAFNRSAGGTVAASARRPAGAASPPGRPSRRDVRARRRAPRPRAARARAAPKPDGARRRAAGSRRRSALGARLRGERVPAARAEGAGRGPAAADVRAARRPHAGREDPLGDTGGSCPCEPPRDQDRRRRREGLITLSPLLGTCPRRRARWSGRGSRSRARSAASTCSASGRRPSRGARSRLTLDVLNGAAVVEWTRGVPYGFRAGRGRPRRRHPASR